ncbi:leucine-rich repeat-containing protein 24-like [Leucoraja erinacea]|uniref:leucine-rich repeat-containing protein 24-like n=1 Tax=Leucoraja erinaceus TaxID=7782 RepID=UPI002456AFA3|nr:leucine-rich repeat-containing protein 24-like [Leucoraja erinacea]
MDLIATLAILSVQGLRSWGCMAGCRCYSTTVECGSLGLTAVPNNIPTFTQTIFLQDNNITRISRKDFSHLSNLQNLYIQNNSLETIEAGALARQRSLLELALNGNHIQQLHPDTFQGLTHLRILYLAANHISHLVGHTFHELQRLQELHLQENSLQSLDEEAFVGLSSLALLDLSNNWLRTLHQASLQPLTSLQELRLIGNRWRCDCGLHWLRSWMVKEGRRLLLGRAIPCSEPPRLSGQSLPEVPASSLICIPPAVSLDRMGASARAGEAVRVACRASGYPVPAVSWRRLGQAWEPGLVELEGTGPLLLPLTLPNVSAAQAGAYVCEARNAGGRAAATFTLLLNTSGLLPRPGREPLYEGAEFGGLGPAAQMGVAAGIALLGLAALLLLLAVIRRRGGPWGNALGHEEAPACGLYLNDYSDGPSTFAQLEEYRDSDGREMFVIDRSRRDFHTYKDTAQGGRLLGMGDPQDQDMQTAQAQAQAQARAQTQAQALAQDQIQSPSQAKVQAQTHAQAPQANVQAQNSPQAQAQIPAQALWPEQASIFENPSTMFKEEIEYEIHC